MDGKVGAAGSGSEDELGSQAAVRSVAGVPISSREGAGRGALDEPESKRAELRMNTISEVTWINDASTGFKYPNAASATPAVSTPKVPAKFVIQHALTFSLFQDLHTDRVADPGRG